MTSNLTISVTEMARRLGISKPTAYQLARREDFPSFNIGNRIVVYEAGLEEWVRRHAQKNKQEVS